MKKEKFEICDQMSPDFVRALFYYILGSEVFSEIETSRPTYAYIPEKKLIVAQFTKGERLVELKADYFPYWFSINFIPGLVEVAFFLNESPKAQLQRTLRELLKSKTFYDEGLVNRETLGTETISFLRYLISFGERLAEPTTILLRPTSQRRARLYKALTQGLNNIIIMDVDLVDDLKRKL